MIYNDGKLCIEEVSDIHLGHHKTTTKEILDALRVAFPNTARLAEIDLLIIAGDVFDRLLQLPDDNVIEIRIWMNDFLRACKKWDVVVRCLEGTPSHDWKQCKHFVAENESSQIGADFKYHSTLCIEYIEKFDMHLLFIPDEWKHDTDDTWLDVKRTMSEHGLDMVDITVMHGAFAYQLPPHVPSPTHDPARYISITRYVVFVGHIHKHSVFDIIISAGSFDRLTHGEEEPKGHVRVVLTSDGKMNITFIENKQAKLYITVTCTGLDMAESLEKLKFVDDLPKGSQIRIRSNKRDVIWTSADALKERFGHVVFTFQEDDKDKIKHRPITEMVKPHTSGEITDSNIRELLMKRLEELTGGQDFDMKRAGELIDDQLLSSGRFS